MSKAESPEQRSISRRRAMQGVVGTGVAAAVWNAPKIDGLSVTPNYAAAASGFTAVMATITSEAGGDWADVTHMLNLGADGSIEIKTMMDKDAWSDSNALEYKMFTLPSGCTSCKLETTIDCPGGSSFDVSHDADPILATDQMNLDLYCNETQTGSETVTATFTITCS